MSDPRDIDAADLPLRVRSLGLDRVSGAARETPVYLVGGAVRDLLLGLERTDVDLAVEGDAAALANRLGKAVRTHERFRTATVDLDGLRLDLAATRAESYAHPGALPDVRPASLAEDLARRDFTINAMAVPLDRPDELIDPHRGRNDLAAGILRVLHRGSFVDDPTRAIRAARYAARFGFEPEPETAELLRGADLSTVSRDRVEGELRRLAAEREPERGLELLAGWGLADPGPDIELVAATLAVLDRDEWRGVAERDQAALAGAGTAVGQYRPPVGAHQAARDLAAARPERPSEAVAAAGPHDGVTLALARALGAEWLDDYVRDWRHVRLEITGDDLLAAGVPEGPAVGAGLAEALRRKLDGEIAGREEELAAALEAARGGGGA